jgi:hypothetical protein
MNGERVEPVGAVRQPRAWRALRSGQSVFLHESEDWHAHCVHDPCITHGPSVTLRIYEWPTTLPGTATS